MTAPGNLEIERKFLVRLTGDPTAMPEARTLELLQLYLIDDGSGSRRIRRTDEGDDVRFHLAAKREISPGVREELEREIEVGEWSDLRRSADPERRPITKTRHVVPAHGRVWEIDVFGGALAGLVLAEIEFATAADLELEVEPPACLEIDADVTDDRRYGNAGLARLDAPPVR